MISVSPDRSLPLLHLAIRSLLSLLLGASAPLAPTIHGFSLDGPIHSSIGGGHALLLVTHEVPQYDVLVNF